MGSLVQLVFVHFSDDQKEEYGNDLLWLAQSLVGFLYDALEIRLSNELENNSEKEQQMQLRPNEFPDWMTASAKETINLCMNLWFVLCRRVTEHGPLMLTSLFKQACQYEYNGGKWGLDKVTEHYLKVLIQSKTLSLEGKYVCIFLIFGQNFVMLAKYCCYVFLPK